MAEASLYALALAIRKAAEPCCGKPEAKHVASRMRPQRRPQIMAWDDRRRWRITLDRARSLAAESGVRAIAELLAGDPVDEIVAYADSTDADVIVVGSRRKARSRARLLGRVSRDLLQEAGRLVLVVPQLAAVPLY